MGEQSPSPIQLISSLISLSFSIKPFSVKWQLIRAKLEDLLSALSAVQNCNPPQTPQFCSEIQSIVATILACNNLAKMCLECTFSGKLLMQSDLDMVLAKIETHVKSVLGIYDKGLVTQDYAIVVPRPSGVSCNDDVRFYVRDILSRWKIGDTQMREQALEAFNEVVGEDERFVRVCVEVDGVVSVLVGFLDCREVGVQERALKGLCLICGFEFGRGVLVSFGVVGPLVRVLEGGSEVGKELASRCLQKVTENSDNAWCVCAHGGVTVLLKICGDGGSSGELVGLACGVLKNLVGVDEIKRFMVEEGAVQLFIKLVRSKDEVSQISSIDFLQTMGCSGHDESTRGLIIKEGGIRVLVRALDPKSSFSSKARVMALRAIVNLCVGTHCCFNSLTSYGFLDHVLYFLRNGEVCVQEMALRASFWLCGISEEAKKVMGDKGFMQELVRFLGAKSFEVREIATETLSSMISVPRNRKRFAHNDQSVGYVMQLLDPEEGNSSNTNRKVLLSILMSLTCSNSGRKNIVNSGYLKNVEKLAEAEVVDAKKIVKKLSSSRLHRLFSGIWHS